MSSPKVFRASGGLGAWGLPWRGPMPWGRGGVETDDEGGLSALLQRGGHTPLLADARGEPLQGECNGLV